MAEETVLAYGVAVRSSAYINLLYRTVEQNKKIMSNEILYILLPEYAAHEIVYLSQAVASDEFAMKENPKYVNKVVAPTMEPVKSIGGFRTMPDYSFETMPDDYAALVLIGGFGWSKPFAEQVVPIVKKAVEKGKIVGAICNAASWMAKHGFLNAVPHTEMYYQFNKQGFCTLFSRN